MSQEQVGRQVNACVLLLINEVELSIYRFSTLGAKNAKKQPQPIELKVDRLTSCWAINAWQVIVRPRSNLDRPGRHISRPRMQDYWKRMKIFCISRLGRYSRSIGTLANWLVLRLVHHFWLKNLYFCVFFSSNT